MTAAEESVVERLYVPATGEWWEPTEDPAWWRTVEPCGDDCHHPVHAFGHPERIRHLEEAAWVKACAASPEAAAQIAALESRGKC